MFKHMIFVYNKHRKTLPDSLAVDLSKWMFLGRYVGFWSSKWCHANATNYTRIDHPERGGCPNANTLILQDIRFFDVKGTRITITLQQTDFHHMTLPHNVKYVELCVRKQKNNNNYHMLNIHEA